MKKSPRPMPSREHQIPKKGHKLEKVEEDGEPKQPAPTIYGVTSAQTASRKLKHRSSALMIQKRKRGDWGEFDLAHAWSPEDLQNDGRVSQSTVHAERPGRESFASNETRPYEMEPAKTFEVLKVQEIIQGVLEGHLADKTYSPEFSKSACIELADIIKERVKRLRYWRYKIICHVIIGDIHQQDVRVASRCTWNPDVDSFAEYEFRNFSLYAIGLVYGVYCE